MKTIETYVNIENYAAFVCPYCQKEYRVSVAEHKATKHKLITKCICKKQFEVELNFRQFYRKNVNLIGEVTNVSTGSRKWYAMTVVNLSMGGLRFKFTGPKDIKMGHRLHVKFMLDDQQTRHVDKEVRVIGIIGDHYGCEFLNLAYEEKELGYYLFPS